MCKRHRAPEGSSKLCRRQKTSDAPGRKIIVNVSPFPIPRMKKVRKKFIPTFDKPTNSQMASLVAHCLPCGKRIAFTKSVETLVKAAKFPLNLPPEKLIGKTPIAWLENAFKSTEVHARISKTTTKDMMSFESLAYIVLGTVTGSKRSHGRLNNSDLFTETILNGYVHPDSEQVSFKNYFILLPHSSVFFMCNHKSVDNKITALPMSWLRLHSSHGTPSKNGFLSDIHDVWQIDEGEHSRHVFDCYQFDDYAEKAPLMAPDVFQGVHVKDQRVARQKYRDMVNAREESGSFRVGCRKYVRGALHQNIPNTCLQLDSREIGDFDLRVVLQNSNYSARDVSIIQCVDVSKEDSLLWQLHQGSKYFKSVPGNCRQHNKDCGRMYGIGEMVCGGHGSSLRITNVTNEEEVCTFLPKIVSEVKGVMTPKFRSVLPQMEFIEDECGRTIPKALGGKDGISCSMNLSNGMGNATHYDINDGSVGFSIWTELSNGDSSNWFFVLPNILIRRNGITYHGVAIQLYHGCAIA